MPDYPAHLIHERELADGRRVTIRPIRREDEPAELAFLRGLSNDSLHTRFMKWVEMPSEKPAHYFSDIDYEHHMAFVCVTRDGEAGARLVGEARYMTNSDGESCDFGVVIADDWHKTGIAGLLMEALIRAARAQGLKRMESTVLRTNSAMLRFARALGFEVRTVNDDPTTVDIIKVL